MESKTYSYLQLNKEIEEQIIYDRAHHILSPYRFLDENIQRRNPNAHDKATLTRSAFGRDIEKIINIPAYNRYADKTQVFSFVENDDICRRGLHVQLVSRIARNIGSLLGLNTDLIEAISLGHDMGHTPYGHAGEKFLSKVYHKHTGRYFNHNVHSVRVLDHLYRRNISLQTLDGALCHNGEFAQQELKLGDTHDFNTFDSLVEQCLVDENTITTLRPSTLEGCVVRVSDMIAYLGKDRIDALDIGAINSYDVFESKKLGISNTHIISNLTVDIVNNSYGKDRIYMSQEIFEDVKKAKRQNSEIIYMKEGMIDDTENIVEEMFEEMYEKLYRELMAENTESPVYKHHINALLHKSRTWTLESYLEEEPNQIIVDYLASMTDDYFIALYHYLFPKSTRSIVKRSYCDDLK